MIRGLIFDFDGLIVDTEWPVYKSWVELFEAFDAKLPLDRWTSIIGTSSHEHFDPFDILEQQIGRPVDRQILGQNRLERELGMTEDQPILPGVEDYLKAARILQLRVGIASSSSRSWVVGNLSRLKLLNYFEVIHTSDDVERTKPDPALYNLTLGSLDLRPDEAVVLEDSPNGVIAARQAGLFVAAVPNPLTSHLNLDQANVRLHSLMDISLADLMQIAENS